eukprot:NP_510108.2 Uncharacterized protein CELE_R09A8.2 [Caenorhabditis elegans]
MEDPKLGSRRMTLRSASRLNIERNGSDSSSDTHSKMRSNGYSSMKLCDNESTFYFKLKSKDSIVSNVPDVCSKPVAGNGKEKTTSPCEIGRYSSFYARFEIDMDDKAELKKLMNSIPENYSIPILRIVQFGEYNDGKEPRSLLSYREKMADVDKFSDDLVIELLDFFVMIRSDVEMANNKTEKLETNAEYYGFKSYDDSLYDIQPNTKRPAPLYRPEEVIAFDPNWGTPNYPHVIEEDKTKKLASALQDYRTLRDATPDKTFYFGEIPTSPINVGTHDDQLCNGMNSISGNTLNTSYEETRQLKNSDHVKQIDPQMKGNSVDAHKGLQFSMTVQNSSCLSSDGNTSTDDRVNAQCFASSGFVKSERRRLEQLMEQKLKEKNQCDYAKKTRNSSALDHESSFGSCPLSDIHPEQSHFDISLLAENKKVEEVSQETAEKQEDKQISVTSLARMIERSSMPANPYSSADTQMEVHGFDSSVFVESEKQNSEQRCEQIKIGEKDREDSNRIVSFEISLDVASDEKISSSTTTPNTLAEKCQATLRRAAFLYPVYPKTNSSACMNSHSSVDVGYNEQERRQFEQALDEKKANVETNDDRSIQFSRVDTGLLKDSNNSTMNGREIEALGIKAQNNQKEHQCTPTEYKSLLDKYTYETGPLIPDLEMLFGKRSTSTEATVSTSSRPLVPDLGMLLGKRFKSIESTGSTSSCTDVQNIDVIAFEETKAQLRESHGQMKEKERLRSLDDHGSKESLSKRMEQERMKQFWQKEKHESSRDDANENASFVHSLDVESNVDSCSSTGTQETSEKKRQENVLAVVPYNPKNISTLVEDQSSNTLKRMLVDTSSDLGKDQPPKKKRVPSSISFSNAEKTRMVLTTTSNIGSGSSSGEEILEKELI